MLEEKLQIVLLTYNRCKTFKNTLDEILAEHSPIRNCDIIILNNKSCDGTDELIFEYQKKFPNITHIRHSYNAGGNVNICRGYEAAAKSGKEYGWVICDDDTYNFSNWKEVELRMNEKKDLICVADYVFPSKEAKNNKAYQLAQLTFVPSAIFRTEDINDNIIFNMFESTYTMFQQLVLPISLINSKKEIYVLSKPIVFNGMHYENKRSNRSYKRGYENSLILPRRTKISWILGYSSIIPCLEDKKLIRECMEVAIPNKDIYNSWTNFYKSLRHTYLNFNDINYFYEIYKLLKLKRKIMFWLYTILDVIPYFTKVLKAFYSLTILISIQIHNIKN